MPKQRPKNAFFFYVQHFKKNEEGKGRIFLNGTDEVVDAASDSWRNLTRAERTQFEEKALRQRRRNMHYGANMTSIGIPVSEFQKADEEKRLKVMQRKKAIADLIDGLQFDDRVTTAPFYVMSVNYFIKDFNGAYWPAELGVIKFSIAGGIMRKYHNLINPGTLPLGFAFEAKSHSAATHKLPPPPNAIGEVDLALVLCNLTEFLCQEPTVNSGFPILVLDTELPIVENIMQQLCDAGAVDKEKYELLPLTPFFTKLRATCENKFGEAVGPKWGEAIAGMFLERDIYRYCGGNGCQIHDEEDVNPECALGRPTRWAYTILEHTMNICCVQDKKQAFHYPIGYQSFKLEQP